MQSLTTHSHSPLPLHFVVSPFTFMKSYDLLPPLLHINYKLQVLCILWNYKGGKIWRWGWSLQCSFFKHAKCPLLHPRTKLWSIKSFQLRWILSFHLTFQLLVIKFVYVCNCVFSSCDCLWIPHKLFIHLFYMVVWKLQSPSFDL